METQSWSRTVLICQYFGTFLLTLIVTISANAYAYAFVKRTTDNTDTEFETSQIRLRKAMKTVALYFFTTSCLQVQDLYYRYTLQKLCAYRNMFGI